MNPEDICVLVPDLDGTLTVCMLGQLVDSLSEGLRLEDAVNGASIDSFAKDDDDLSNKIAKVAVLNANGDTAAYWDLA